MRFLAQYHHGKRRSLPEHFSAQAIEIVEKLPLM
jgi:hypothetical protein